MIDLSEDDLKQLTFGGLLKIMSATRIYKYISFDDGLKFLINENQLKFNTPNRFNDPFDCNPIFIKLDISKEEFNKFIDHQPFDRAKKRKLKAKKDSKLIMDSMIHKRNKTWICCFSETNNDNLMWAHYGDYHRGLCIGFEFPIKYKDEFVLYPVHYEKELEVARFTEDTNRVLYYWLTTKSADWANEKEIRAIKLKDNEKCNFEKSNIKEIVMGYKISNNDKDRLQKALKQNRYSKDIEINQIDIDKNELKLKVKPALNK